MVASPGTRSGGQSHAKYGNQCTQHKHNKEFAWKEFRQTQPQYDAKPGESMGLHIPIGYNAKQKLNEDKLR